MQPKLKALAPGPEKLFKMGNKKHPMNIWNSSKVFSIRDRVEAY